jgi:DNA-binding Xre family transcriptional regulator
MPFRAAELLAARKLTGYALHKASKGRIPLRTAYRVVDGSVDRLPAAQVLALCEVLGVSPNQLFGWDRGKG